MAHACMLMHSMLHLTDWAISEDVTRRYIGYGSNVTRVVDGILTYVYGE